jgi:hypothetical protein
MGLWHLVSRRDAMKKQSGKGNRTVKDLPARTGQNVRGGAPAAQTTTFPKETLTLPYTHIEWTYT